MASTDEATVTRSEASRILGAGDRTLRRLISRGDIRVVRGVGTRQLLARDDVTRLATRTTISQDEAAERLGVSDRTVRRRLRAGEIDGVPAPGGRTRILATTLATTSDNRVLDSALDTSGHDLVGQGADKLDMSGHKDGVSGHVQDNEDAAYVPLLVAPPALDNERTRPRHEGRRRVLLVPGVLVAGLLTALVAWPRATQAPTAPVTSTPTSGPTLPVATPIVVSGHDRTPVAATPAARPTKAPPVRKRKPVSRPVRRTHTGQRSTPVPTAPVRVPDPECMALYGPEGLC